MTNVLGRLMAASVATVAFAAVATTFPASAGQDCNCSRPKPRPVLVCASVDIAPADWVRMLKDVRFHGKWFMGNRAAPGFPKNSVRTQTFYGPSAQVCKPYGHPPMLFDLGTFWPGGGRYWARF